jgi:hypothetical protein
MFVGAPNQVVRREDVPDGLSHTLLCAETIDNTPATIASGGSRLIFASDVCMVGLPTLDANGAAIPDNKGHVYFDGIDRSVGGGGYYYTPAGLLGPPSEYSSAMPLYGDENPNANYRAYRTYLSFKFDGVDAGLYPSYGYGNNWAVNPNRPIYGPSSMHPTVVNHLLCDGSVASVVKDIDVACYFFSITRNNGDPMPLKASLSHVLGPGAHHTPRRPVVNGDHTP